METNFTPLLAMKSRALLTFAILWNLILPRSGFGNVSPEITSSSSINFRPFLKSSSIFSMAVPAFLKCELHQAVKVCKQRQKFQLESWRTRGSRSVIPFGKITSKIPPVCLLISVLLLITTIVNRGGGHIVLKTEEL